MKKKLTIFYAGVGLLCFICIALSAFLVYNSLDELGLGVLTEQPVVLPEDQGSHLYSEPKNPTAVHREYYDQLIEVSKKYPDEFEPYEISRAVIRCFISDFYTWTNKEGNYDVGGLGYLYGPNHLTFALYARDTYYQNFNHFEKEFGIENLMEVESVSFMNETFAGDIEINGELMPAYYFEVEWTYKEGSLMDTSKLQCRGAFTVVENKEAGRFEIARIYNIE